MVDRKDLIDDVLGLLGVDGQRRVVGEPNLTIAERLDQIIAKFRRNIERERKSPKYKKIRASYNRWAKKSEDMMVLVHRASDTSRTVFGLPYQQKDIDLYDRLKEFADEQRKNAERVKSAGGARNLYKTNNGPPEWRFALDLYYVFKQCRPRGTKNDFQALCIPIIESERGGDKSEGETSKITREAYRVSGFIARDNKRREEIGRRLACEQITLAEISKLKRERDQMNSKLAGLKTPYPLPALMSLTSNPPLK